LWSRANSLPRPRGRSPAAALGRPQNAAPYLFEYPSPARSRIPDVKIQFAVEAAVEAAVEGEFTPLLKGAVQLVFLAVCALVGQAAGFAQLSLSAAMELALRNSPQVRADAADVRRAEADLSSSTSPYVPSFSLGSSLGYSYGYPLGQPEVFSITGQSLVFSFSQKDYVRSARAALYSAQLQLKDTRQQVLLDTALAYVELAEKQEEIAALEQEKEYGDRLVDVEQERVEAGRDTGIELTEAKLAASQTVLERLRSEDRADELKARLAHLTGLPPSDLTVTDSSRMPSVPSAGAAIFSEGAAAPNDGNGVQAAYASAKAKLYTAYGDARQDNRPTISFFATYGLFSNTLNNYSQYYIHFQQSNFGAGVQIVIPLLDASREAKKRSSSAEAARAEALADQLRDQSSEQLLQLKKNVAELAAQQQVATLQAELAKERLDAVATQTQTGGAPGATPMTPKDEEEALIEERRRYVAMLGANFQLLRSRLTLLRALGQIEVWAKSQP
jgi:outer membrane protein TolC